MKVLLAIDGSPNSVAAVDSVVERPWPKGAVFRVISCIANPIPVMQGMIPEATLPSVPAAQGYEQMDEAQELTKAAAERLRDRHLAVEVAIRRGDPDHTIVNEASEWGAERVVMGANDERSVHDGCWEAR